MKSVKKSILLVVCALALVTASVFGTLAYLTDTAEVVNTFTVGNVSIDLDETLVDPDGNPIDRDGDSEPDRTKEGNEYHLIPGKTYTKDPVMTVLAGSEPAYVRMKVTVADFEDVADLIKKYVTGGTEGAMAELDNWLGGWDPEVWVPAGLTVNNDDNTATLEFRYKEAVSGYDEDGNAVDVKLPALFTDFQVPEFVLADDLALLDEFTITVTGEAMQASGFEGEDGVAGAWSEFDEQAVKKSESTPAVISEEFQPSASAAPEETGV